jgi:hypothetical protein
MTTVKLRGFVLALVLCGFSSAASANPVYWTDWTRTLAGAPGVVGTLTTGSATIDVSFSGLYSFAQVSGGTNYWNPSAPYLSGLVSNAPPASDIIALNTGGTGIITFSQPVLDPLIAIVSWNTNTVNFGVPIEILSYGMGYWGNGTPVLNAGGTGFYGSGEVHGVIRLPGEYSSITFTHTSENWHGLTVGVVDAAPPAVPEPASLLLFGTGLAGLRAWRKRRQ